MKILFAQTAYPPSIGGVQIHQHRLACTLSHKHDVTALCQWERNRTDWLLGTTLFSPSAAKDYVVDGIRVHKIGLALRDRLLLAPLLPIYYPATPLCAPIMSDLFLRHVDPFVADADVIHNARIGREYLSLALYRSARRHGKAFVFTPVHHPRWIGYRHRVFSYLSKRADAVVALTKAEKKILTDMGILEDRIFVTGIGPVVNEDAVAERFKMKYDVNAPFVLFLGQHFSYKGFKHVLKAMPIVWEKCPSTHFVFAGPAVGNSERSFKRHSDHRVRRIRKLSAQEKTDALSACALLCVPSTQESFGGVYTEAWSFEKPVIGAQIPSVSDLIHDGEDGYLVQPDHNMIAQRIVALLEDPERAGRMGKKGRQKVLEKYSWEKISHMTEGVYTYALDNRKAELK
jgi:glycosyltransferase involved in cell wall biosynthesis